MKFLIHIFIILYILLGENAFSQDNEFGFKGGLNTSGIFRSPGYKSGFLLGFGLTKPLKSKKEFISGEFIIEQKCYIEMTRMTDGFGVYQKFDINHNFTYITLPIIYKLYANEEFKYFIEFGLYPSYMILARIDNLIMNSNGELILKKNTSTYIKNHLDFGFLIGGGIRLKINDSLGLIISSRINHSFISTLYGHIR